MFKDTVRIQSGLAGPVWQIWVSGPLRSGSSYAQYGQALWTRVAQRVGHMAPLALLNSSAGTVFTK